MCILLLFVLSCSDSLMLILFFTDSVSTDLSSPFFKFS